MDKAAARLIEALRAGERIAIYGDYDVDGVSATAILYHTFRALAPGCDVVSYVPHRLEEGYGLNSDAIRELAQNGARVIVSVDCGVTAIEPAEVAASLGVDLIITDHHNPPASAADLPRAYAVVHPRHPESAYPFGELCGAGVAFKLAWRLATMWCGAERVSEHLRALLLDMLPLAALGVIADIVPLVDENRVIARAGLARIKSAGNPGLRALVEAAGLAGENVSAEDVGFKLGPRLNACGRMGHAREAVELLTTATGARAMELARQLTTLNDSRRATERVIFEEAVQLAETKGMTGLDRRAIVLAHKGWHAGVVGIVCSRLVERFHRPTVLLSIEGDTCHGSARSIDGFNLHQGLIECSQHLSTFGGHDMAAGMKLASCNLDAFTESFIEVCNRAITPQDLVARLHYDCDVTIPELSMREVGMLDAMSPFGRANPAVTLRLRRVRVAGKPGTFGQYNKHLELFVSLGPGQAALRCIGWNWAERSPLIPPGAWIDALIRPQINTWGKGRVEAELVDVMVHEPGAFES
jgi:single-stranded-DNA-specific exonuclease